MSSNELSGVWADVSPGAGWVTGKDHSNGVFGGELGIILTPDINDDGFEKDGVALKLAVDIYEAFDVNNTIVMGKAGAGVYFFRYFQLGGGVEFGAAYGKPSQGMFLDIGAPLDIVKVGLTMFTPMNDSTNGNLMATLSVNLGAIVGLL